MGRLKAVWETPQWMILILVAHFALGTLYSTLIPLWEGYDEWAHYRYIQHVASTRKLPRPGETLVTEQGMLDESLQPPLYYLLGALVTSWIDTGDGRRPAVNPYAFSGTGEGGVNVAVHDPRVESFPYRGTVLAVHVARLLSVLLGTAAVWATYLTGRLIFPGRPEVALGAAAFHAFAPQFLFIGAIVNNDILAVTVCSFVLLLTVRIVVRGPRLSDLGLLAAGLGLGLLAKHTTLAVVPVAGVGVAVALIRAARARGWRASLRWAGVGAALLVAGWWGVDSLAHRYVMSLPDYLAGLGYSLTHLEELPWPLLPDALRYGYKTFWASFGWGNVEAEPWVYWALGLLALLGAAGVIVGRPDLTPDPFPTREGEGRGVQLNAPTLNAPTPSPGRIAQQAGGEVLLALLALDVFCAVALPMYRELLLGRALLKGRYMLVAMPAFSLLIVYGLTRWVPRRAAGVQVAAVSLTLLALAIITPFHTIAPAYAPPPLLAASEAERVPNPVQVRFGEGAEWVGYDVGRGRVRAGEAVAITLYWRCLGQIEQNYTLAVKVLGADHQEYGGVDLYPGRGNFATSLWRPGDLLRETYWVPVTADAPAPCLGRIGVALYLADSGEHLAATDGEGHALGRTAVVGRLKVRPRVRIRYDVEQPVHFRLGKRVALVGYALDESRAPAGTLSLTLYWQALAKPDQDYTVFVHVLDKEGRLLAGRDSPPRGGAYPTSLWDQGEVVRDEWELTLPAEAQAAEYRVTVGMYVLETMQRLPVFDAEGERMAGDEVTLKETRD